VEEVFAEAGREAGKVFRDEMLRNVQGIIAEFLEDPFKDGIKGMLISFSDMLRRMAAQALAARIAEKIFGGFDKWIDKVLEALKKVLGKALPSGGATPSTAPSAPTALPVPTSLPMPLPVPRMPGGEATGGIFKCPGMEAGAAASEAALGGCGSCEAAAMAMETEACYDLKSMKNLIHASTIKYSKSC
jgi:hypothetical protein